jgi:hypothetical protein
MGQSARAPSIRPRKGLHNTADDTGSLSKSGATIMQRSAAMKHYVGRDVSVKETSVCIVA